MKILIATGIYPPDIGGPATYAKLLVERMPSYGIETEVISFGSVRRYPKILRHILYFVKVFKAALKVDLIFTQDTVSSGFPALLVAKILRKPIVLRVPGDYVWEQSAQRYGIRDGIDDFQNKKYGLRVELLRKIQKLTVKYADEVIAPSYYFRDLVQRWTDRSKPVIKIYNGVDLDVDFEKREKFETPTMITAGRLVPWKGIDKLLEIVSKLPKWNLIIAGEGPERESLEKLSKKLGIQSRVKFTGNLERKDLFSEIYRSHIFVLNTYFESFSFQIVEAMFLGVPVITTDVGNLAEIIESGKEGILIEPDNEEQFLSAVERIVNNQEFRDGLVKNAREKANKFSIEATHEQLVSLFNKVMLRK